MDIPFDPPAHTSVSFPVTESDISGAFYPVTTDGPSLADLTSAEMTSLTPDSLLAYCQARLDSINGQVTGLFNEQEVQNGEASALQPVIAAFQTNAGGVNSGDSQGASKCTTMEVALGGLIQQIKDSDPGFADLGKLEQTYNDILYSGTGPQPANGTTPALQYFDPSIYPPNQNGPKSDNILSSDEVQAAIQSLQGCASDLNSGSELQMIQLQSLMSQQSTAVELTTNLVQSLGDESEKVAENIGH
jgi:hypothetical protein